MAHPQTERLAPAERLARLEIENIELRRRNDDLARRLTDLDTRIGEVGNRVGLDEEAIGAFIGGIDKLIDEWRRRPRRV